MKKKLLLFTLINLCIAVLTAMAPIALIGGGEYERQRVVFDFVESVQPGQHLSVIVGDSRSECCLAAADMGFVNLSVAGGAPPEGYYLVRRLLDRGARIDRLVVSFGGFHVHTQDAYYARTRYYGLIDRAFIDEVNRKIVELDDAEYRRYGWKALETIDASLSFLPEAAKFGIVNVLSLDTTIKGAIRGARRRLDPATEREVSDPRFKLREISTAESVNDEADSPESQRPDAASPVNGHYLSRLVALARENGTAVYFLNMPMNAGVTQPPQQYFHRFDDVIARSGFEGCYSGARFWPNTLFWDASHLNADGAARLRAELAPGLSYCLPGQQEPAAAATSRDPATARSSG
jgi:hypothetical protein